MENDERYAIQFPKRRRWKLKMTPKRLQVLRVMAGYYQDRQLWPSLRSIGQVVSRDVSSIALNLAALEFMEYVTPPVDYRKPRMLTKKGWDAAGYYESVCCECGHKTWKKRGSQYDTEQVKE